MKILVTGGAGFIGSHIVDKLIELNHEVIVVDNLATGKQENINPKARFYHADITNYNELKEIFDKEMPDIVNHHAAQASVPKSFLNPQSDAKTNIIGTLNLLELSSKHHIRKFIYANSGGAGYGEPLSLPIGENHPISPLSHYGISKHTVEHYITLYNSLYNLPYVSLRYANVYGPRQNSSAEGGVIAIFANKLLHNERPTIFGTGEHLRDYIYVHDVVSANLLAIDNKKAENQVFNVGTSQSTSTQEIFDKIKTLTKSNLEPIYTKERAGDLKASCLDSSRLQKLGWKPEYNLDKGLKETLSFFKNV